jgi:heparan-alpha-glucosaminide N-acetyltransferase
MDYAEILFSTTSSVRLYAVNDFCYKCSKQLVSDAQSTLDPENLTCAHVYSPHKWQLYVVDSLSLDVLYDEEVEFGEKGRYVLEPAVVAASDSSIIVDSMELSVTEEPIDSNRAVYVLIGVIFGIVFLSYIIPCCCNALTKSYQKNRDLHDDKIINFNPSNSSYRPLLADDNPSPGAVINDSNSAAASQANQGSESRPESSGKEKKKSERLQSLDTFRGFSLYCMIFVNYGSGGYWYFDHADWNGVTIADFLFPWFMWMMGVSMAMSYQALDKQATAAGLSIQQHHQNLWFKATKRSLIFFALGVFYANGYHYDIWRIPGVLQYFGISYFVSSATLILCKTKTEETLKRIQDDIEFSLASHSIDSTSSCSRGSMKQWFKALYILTAYRYEWIIQAAVLFIFLSLTFVARMPGCPIGYNGPGGISEDSQHLACTGGIHKYIDTLLFTSKHIFHSPTCQRIYNCK